MYFSRVYLTSNGYAALSSAAAGSTSSSANASKIIWGEAYTSSVDIRNDTVWTQARINSATKSDFPSTTYTSHGSVTEVSTGLYPPSAQTQYETATLTIEVTNGSESGGTYQYSGDAYTLCVLGKKEEDANYELFIVASIGQNDSPEPVSSTQPFKAILNCHIQLSHDVINVVMAADNWYAPAAAFNDLKLRAVTTHIEGNDSVGEDQSIRGVKTFLNDTYFSSNILPNGNNYIGDNTANGRWDTVYATTFDGTTFTGTANKAICDNDGNTISSYYCTVSTNQNISGVKSFTSDMYSNSCIHALGNSSTAGLRLCDGLTYEQYAYCAITGYEDRPSSRMTFHFVNKQANLDYKVTWTGPNTSTSGSETLITAPMSSGTWSIGTGALKLNSVQSNKFYGDVKPSTLFSLNGLMLDFDCDNPRYSGTCSSASTSSEKQVTCSGFSLRADYTIAVNFTNSNSKTDITLNVNNTGAKSIVGATSWSAGSTVLFRYDGECWHRIAYPIYSNSNYATCYSGNSANEKVATIQGKGLFMLTTGARVAVFFNYNNTSTSPTLNVNNTGAKPMKICTIAPSGYTVPAPTWAAGSIVDFVYNGSYWVIVNSDQCGVVLEKNGAINSTSNTRTALVLRSLATNNAISTVYLSDIIANALCGTGGTDSSSTDYDSVGALGLFYYCGTLSGTSNVHKLVNGSTLHRFSMVFYNSSGWTFDNTTFTVGGSSSQSVSINKSSSTRSGTWCILNSVFTSSNYLQVVLAIRVY